MARPCNPGGEVVWLDGLDTVGPLLDTDSARIIRRVAAGGGRRPRWHATAQFASIDYGHRISLPVPYPYARTRRHLSNRQQRLPWRAWLQMKFVNPATGGYPMPTIGAFVQHPGRFPRQPVSLYGRNGVTASKAAADYIDGIRSRSPRRTSRRAGLRTPARPTPTPCCSASPTGRSSVPWGCGANSFCDAAEPAAA